ncbi:hypothetical protein VTN96DRAFT_2767 [Rasamsonia emersonii]
MYRHLFKRFPAGSPFFSSGLCYGERLSMLWRDLDYRERKRMALLGIGELPVQLIVRLPLTDVPPALYLGHVRCSFVVS